MPKNNPKTWHLTFDDGPTPEITEWVLDQLRHHQAKATFFCIGKQVAKHPELYQRILAEGHQIGNHTFSHLNSWKTAKKEYLEDVEKASKSIHSKLFRPPYGKLKWGHYRALKKDYTIVMWSNLAWDWLPNLNAEKKAHELIQQSGHGAILVFHDSIKASKNIKIILPILLHHATAHGIQLASIKA